MAVHQKVRGIVSRFASRELHAARSGREVLDALVSVVIDSPGETVDSLLDELIENVEALLTAMPPYAPPVNAMNHVLSRVEEAQREGMGPEALRASLANGAKAFQEESLRGRTRIAQQVQRLISEGSSVFTFTLSETVLGALMAAAEAGVRFRVLVSESRPNSDGLTTARTLAQGGVPVEAGTDAGMGELMAQSDLMLVGAEAVLSDGAAICKVGTYPAALIAKRSGIPLYVAVDTWKMLTPSRLGIVPELEPLARHDVVNAGLPERVAVTGHLFDCVPAELIRALVTERGLISPRLSSLCMLEMPMSNSVAARLMRPDGGGRWPSTQRL